MDSKRKVTTVEGSHLPIYFHLSEPESTKTQSWEDTSSHLSAHLTGNICCKMQITFSVTFCSWHLTLLFLQSMGNVTDCPCHLLSLDLPVSVFIHVIWSWSSLHYWQYCQPFFRCWYRLDIFCGVSWYWVIPSCWWSKENCNKVIMNAYAIWSELMTRDSPLKCRSQHAGTYSPGLYLIFVQQCRFRLSAYCSRIQVTVLALKH